MRVSVMLVLAAVFSVELVGAQQPKTQTRLLPGHSYLVTVNVTATTRTWYGGRKNDLTVTKGDITIVIDNSRTLPALKVEPEKDRPGHYLVSFSPPLDMRDRKTHDVEIKIKDASMKTKMSF